MKLAFGNRIPNLTEDELFRIQESSEQWFEQLLPVNGHLPGQNGLDRVRVWELFKMRYADRIRSADTSLSERWEIRKQQLYIIHGIFKQLLLLSSTIQTNEIFRRPFTQMHLPITRPDGNIPAFLAFPYGRFFADSWRYGGVEAIMAAINKLLLCFNSLILCIIA